MAVLLDPSIDLLKRNKLVTTFTSEIVIEISEVYIDPHSNHPNLLLANTFHSLYRRIQERFAKNHCWLDCLDHQFVVLESGVIQILTTAVCNSEAADVAEIDTVSSENVIQLPEDYNKVETSFAAMLPDAAILNDYGRVCINYASTAPITESIRRAIRGLKAYALAIGGNGVCALKVDPTISVYWNRQTGNEYTRISLSGDIVLLRINK